jgi:recombination associated protein RdgC
MRTGLLNGNLTFSRYRVVGEMPGDFAAFVNVQIRKFAFQNFKSESDEIAVGWTSAAFVNVQIRSDEIAVGWTSIDNVLDTGFSHANYALGDYLVFSMRMDKKHIPPALLKLKTQEAEKEFLKERKQARLFTDQRRQIAESVRANLFSKTMATPAFFDVCWCVSERWIIFSSHSETITDIFIKLFERTFQLKCDLPELFDPKLLEDSGIDTRFLERDFLTWLLFISEVRSGTIPTKEGTVIDLIFANRLILETSAGEYTETVSCSGPMNCDMAESKTALKNGKKIKEARLNLKKDNSEYEFTFKADGLRIQSLKMPNTIAPAEDQDQDGRTLERIYHIEAVLDAMDRLYSAFINNLVTGRWIHEEIPAMKRWMERG